MTPQLFRPQPTASWGLFKQRKTRRLGRIFIDAHLSCRHPFRGNPASAEGARRRSDCTKGNRRARLPRVYGDGSRKPSRSPSQRVHLIGIVWIKVHQQKPWYGQAVPDIKSKWQARQSLSAAHASIASSWRAFARLLMSSLRLVGGPFGVDQSPTIRNERRRV
jgi:hypothetical protein